MVMRNADAMLSQTVRSRRRTVRLRMPNSAPMHAAKAAFRSRLLAARRALTAEVRGSADAALVAGAVQLVRGRAAAAYVPMTGEPGGPALLDVLAGAARRLLLPILREDLDLDWAEG